MSVTVEMSESDAYMWKTFKRVGAWVAASEYRRVTSENAELREFAADMLRLLKATSAKYPRLFDPNLAPGGMMIKANPIYVFMERARELGADDV